MIVCDTAPIVAAALYKDPDHHRCVELFTGLRLANRLMVLPAPIVAEVGYLLAAKAGARTEADFLRALADLPLGTSDASVIALAERLGVDEVATLDHRHFTVVRPCHIKALTLLP